MPVEHIQCVGKRPLLAYRGRLQKTAASKATLPGQDPQLAPLGDSPSDDPILKLELTHFKFIVVSFKLGFAADFCET